MDWPERKSSTYARRALIIVAALPPDLQAAKPMLAKQETSAVLQAEMGPNSMADAIVLVRPREAGKRSREGNTRTGCRCC